VSGEPGEFHPGHRDRRDRLPPLGGKSSLTLLSPKLLWLALRNITADWSRATREWKSAMNQFAILYAERFKPNAA
jgi:hypothetical protein